MSTADPTLAILKSDTSNIFLQSWDKAGGCPALVFSEFKTCDDQVPKGILNCALAILSDFFFFFDELDSSS